MDKLKRAIVIGLLSIALNRGNLTSQAGIQLIDWPIIYKSSHLRPGTRPEPAPLDSCSVITPSMQLVVSHCNKTIARRTLSRIKSPSRENIAYGYLEVLSTSN